MLSKQATEQWAGKTTNVHNIINVRQSARRKLFLEYMQEAPNYNATFMTRFLGKNKGQEIRAGS
jgi:hypothetical protein